MRRFIIFFILFTLGCTSSKIIEIKINSYHSRSSDPKTTDSRLEVFRNGGFINYRYKEDNLPDSIFNYLIKQEPGNNNSIFFFETQIPLVGVDTFYKERTMVEVFKYEYDNENLVDDKLEIYFIAKHGMVFMKSVDWGFFSTFSSRKNSTEEIVKYLLQDTTGFYFDPPIDFESLLPIKTILENKER